MKGWISVHRQLQEHWLWQDKPFSKGQAWIDLLMSVNHDDSKFLLGNELIELKRGQKVTSIRQLCECWGWSNNKVVAFLDLLEQEGMLIRKSDSKKTVITIEKYEEYQGEERAKATLMRQESDSDATEMHTNNNDNNANNDNKYKSIYDYYLTLNLIKHKSYTNAMTKAIKKAMTENNYDIEDCKTLLKRHETVVEKTKNTQFPVKARSITEFFGQKVYNATHLICSEYDEGGKYYEEYIKSKKITRIGVPPCESVLGERRKDWM